MAKKAIEITTWCELNTSQLCQGTSTLWGSCKGRHAPKVEHILCLLTIELSQNHKMGLVKVFSSVHGIK